MKYKFYMSHSHSNPAFNYDGTYIEIMYFSGYNYENAKYKVKKFIDKNNKSQHYMNDSANYLDLTTRQEYQEYINSSEYIELHKEIKKKPWWKFW